MYQGQGYDLEVIELLRELQSGEVTYVTIIDQPLRPPYQSKRSHPAYTDAIVLRYIKLAVLLAVVMLVIFVIFG
jgi:hypothetical protein